MTPRCMRNNNPLNIRRGANWIGLAPEQTDREFCRFSSMVYGWRAAFVLLTRTYYFKYHLSTIRKIITRWAPPRENKTEGYISHVSKKTGLPPDESIGPPSMHPYEWMAIAWAMAEFEGAEFAAKDVFPMLEGWKLAYDKTLKGDYKQE